MEPLSNLDALLREQVREELKQIFTSQNKPVVYVTHNQTEAMTLSTKVVVLLDGNIQQISKPGRIYTHPANKFVAGFVGSPQMNLLTLKCERDNAILGDAIFPLPKKINFSTIDFGIRPEDVTLAQETDRLTIEGEVLLTENFGRELLVSVKVNNSNQIIRVLLNPELNWQKENIKLALNPQRFHWFCSDTSMRVE